MQRHVMTYHIPQQGHYKRKKRRRMIIVNPSHTPASPSKALLDEIHYPHMLHLPNHLSHIICQPARSTDCHAHGAHLFIHFRPNDLPHVGSPRKHLHRRAWADQLLGGLWSRDEELYVQD